MINPAQIPPEVVEAAAKALAEHYGWTCLSALVEIPARAAIAAALAAWPNAKTLRDDGRRQTYIVPALILPLSQEARDVTPSTKLTAMGGKTRAK